MSLTHTTAAALPAPTGGPSTDPGKAIASRNATTHGVFARDVVLPALGEDPEGYQQLQAAWTTQLVPRNLLEQHYVRYEVMPKA